MVENVTREELAKILGDTNLLEVFSEENWSRYNWKCGCFAVRFLESGAFLASFCTGHARARRA